MKEPAVSSMKETITLCTKCQGAGFVHRETDYDYHNNFATLVCEKCEKCDGHGLLEVTTVIYCPSIEEKPYDPVAETKQKIGDQR